MIERTNRNAGERLEREGRRLVAIGALVGGPLAALATLSVAWFITYIGDDSGECEVACQTGNPLWYIAGAVIALEVLTLARMVGGGSIALLLGGLGGLGVALLGLAYLSRGGHGALPALYLVAIIGSGLALALGAAARLTARSTLLGGEPRQR